MALESLLADAALVGPLARVGLVVSDEVRGPGEAAVAAGTDELAVGVSSLVEDEEALAGEVLHALVARVHHFSRRQRVPGGAGLPPRRAAVTAGGSGLGAGARRPAGALLRL